MNISDQMQDGMAEATRLTREGRLAEATAAIQRALGGEFPMAASGATVEGPVETARRDANEAPRIAPTPPEADRSGHALRRAPRPPRGFRGMPDLPAGLSGVTPGAVARTPEPAVIPAGGRFDERSYTNQAGTRGYKLYVPSGYVGQEATLIVMLHGCTQNPDDFATGTHMNALAEEHTFLAAYPEQARNDNMQGCWNWFNAADQQRGRGEPSIIAGITCEVLGEYNVAIDRVYVAGMSAGGAMAAIMGSSYPDLYAAVGVHSGLAPGAAHDLSSGFAAMQRGGTGAVRQDISRDIPDGNAARVVPVISFHGDRDTTVHPRNAEQLHAHYRAAGRPASPVTVRKGQTPGGYSYTHATDRDADGRAVTEQWTVHGLGHAWSGGSRPGSYTDPNGPDASVEMVRFFNQHPREEPTRRPAG